jgi:NTE family protein
MTDTDTAAEPDPVRVGLALSGGGFRASFFHIGVLARLAELDILRKIEVISTVSGGSIVGALYYLHVKNLLEEKADDAIERSDYIEIVQAVEEDFLAFVKQNLRARIFFNPAQNAHMCLPYYSRTNRIGQLLDRRLYRPVWKGELPPARWWGRGEIPLHELVIKPEGQEDLPRDAINAIRQRNKIPALLINATSLNTGRNWRFEAIRMGEAEPGDPEERRLHQDLDITFHLERQCFYQRPWPPFVRDHGVGATYPLGLAVAASAAVPTLFHPLSINWMYKGIAVALVDGGLHDNQGVQGLFDTECNRMIISDASGQIREHKKPITRIPAVAERTMDIYGARLRHEQLVLARNREAGTVALVHLRRGIWPREVKPRESLKDEPPTDVTVIGVSAVTQWLLSRIRTDLDNFGDVEAASLSLDGYLMIDEELRTAPSENGRPAKLGKPGIAQLGENQPAPPDPEAWRFGAIEPILTTVPPPRRLTRRLEVGEGRLLKPIRFVPKPARIGAITLIGIAGLAAVGWLLSANWNAVQTAQMSVWPVGVCVIVVLLAAGSYFATNSRFLVFRWCAAAVSLFVGLLLAVPLWIMSCVQLAFNQLYLSLAGYKRIGCDVPGTRAQAAMTFSSRPSKRRI